MNMKAINIKLATFSFAAMLLASCSDSGNDSVIDPIGKAATIVGTDVTAEYADQLASEYGTIKVHTLIQLQKLELWQPELMLQSQPFLQELLIFLP